MAGIWILLLATACGGETSSVYVDVGGDTVAIGTSSAAVTQTLWCGQTGSSAQPGFEFAVRWMDQTGRQTGVSSAYPVCLVNGQMSTSFDLGWSGTSPYANTVTVYRPARQVRSVRVSCQGHNRSKTSPSGWVLVSVGDTPVAVQFFDSAGRLMGKDMFKIPLDRSWVDLDKMSPIASYETVRIDHDPQFLVANSPRYDHVSCSLQVTDKK